MPNLRVTAVATILLVLAGIGAGCNHWRVVPIAGIEASPPRLERNRRVRLTAADGTSLEMVVHDVQFPFIAGTVIGEPGRHARVNLHDVRRLELRELNTGATIGVVALGVTTLAATLYLVALSSLEPN